MITFKYYIKRFIEDFKYYYEILRKKYSSFAERSKYDESTGEPGDNPLTFQRGLLDTIIGFLHTVLGFTSIVWSTIKIAIVGYNEVFKFGNFLGFYNYFFEANSILLWISGILILRGKKSGKILGLVWAVNTLFFYISSYYIRVHYWGALVLKPNWIDILIIYYSIIFILSIILKPAFNILMDYLKKNVFPPEWEYNKGSMLRNIISTIKKNGYRGRR